MMPGMNHTRKPFFTPARCAAWLLAAASTGAQADVLYRFTSEVYGRITNYQAPCGGGGCVAIPANGRVQAHFTTAQPLPPNLGWNEDIVPQLTSWQVSNGAILLTHETPGVRVMHFHVATDAAGQITETRILISRWMDGAPGPHAQGDRVAVVNVNSNHTNANYTVLNAPCQTLGTSNWGVPDACRGFLEPPAESSRADYTSGTWVMAAPRARISSVAWDEGDAGTAQMLFNVDLSIAPVRPASLRWRTVNGSAHAPQDYRAASGTLTWPAGSQATRTIAIDVHGDTEVEPDKTFTVELFDFVGMAGADGATVATGTITNDDVAPPPPPAPAATPVPVLSPLALAALSAVMLGSWRISRRRAQPDSTHD